MSWLICKCLGDWPKRIYQIAQDYCSSSKPAQHLIRGRDIRRIVSYVTDVATLKTDEKTSKVVNSLREIALIDGFYKRLSGSA